MKIKTLHPWNLSPKEAVECQRKLVQQLVSKPLEKVRWVAGADISYSRFKPELFASVVVIDLEEKMKVVEIATAVGRAEFPYISGFLAFREIPTLLKAFENLRLTPDVIICDGQGIAHPRGLGIASHLGLWLDIPTIGCGKSRLVGEFKVPSQEKGGRSSLIYQSKEVGAVVRSKNKVAPLFISSGHLIDLESSLQVIQNCLTSYRLPEPIRIAHAAVNETRKHFYLR